MKYLLILLFFFLWSCNHNVVSVKPNTQYKFIRQVEVGKDSTRYPSAIFVIPGR